MIGGTPLEFFKEIIQNHPKVLFLFELCKTGGVGGGGGKFYPYKKGRGGADKVLSLLKGEGGGHKRF